MKDQLVGRPPTIGDMKKSGAIGVRIRCSPPCKRLGSLSFNELGLPDEALFAQITSLRRLRCQFCDRIAKPQNLEVDRGPFSTYGRGAV